MEIIIPLVLFLSIPKNVSGLVDLLEAIFEGLYTIRGFRVEIYERSAPKIGESIFSPIFQRLYELRPKNDGQASTPLEAYTKLEMKMMDALAKINPGYEPKDGVVALLRSVLDYGGPVTKRHFGLRLDRFHLLETTQDELIIIKGDFPLLDPSQFKGTMLSIKVTEGLRIEFGCKLTEKSLIFNEQNQHLRCKKSLWWERQVNGKSFRQHSHQGLFHHDAYFENGIKFEAENKIFLRHQLLEVQRNIIVGFERNDPAKDGSRKKRHLRGNAGISVEFPTAFHLPKREPPSKIGDVFRPLDAYITYHLTVVIFKDPKDGLYKCARRKPAGAPVTRNRPDRDGSPSVGGNRGSSPIKGPKQANNLNPPEQMQLPEQPPSTILSPWEVLSKGAAIRINEGLFDPHWEKTAHLLIYSSEEEIVRWCNTSQENKQANTKKGPIAQPDAKAEDVEDYASGLDNVKGRMRSGSVCLTTFIWTVAILVPIILVLAILMRRVQRNKRPHKE